MPALIYLAKLKGYLYLGSNKVGSNSFFEKNEHFFQFNDLNTRMSKDQPGVREYVDSSGNLTYELGYKMLADISYLQLYNVETKINDTIANIYNINK